MPKRILVTGGSGFLGSHMVAFLLENTAWDIIVLDRLDFSGTMDRLNEVIKPEDKHRVKFVWHDLKAPINEFTAKEIGEVEHVIHMAAGSHVDRSIEDPMSFVMDNVVGTTNLLIWAKTKGMKKVWLKDLNNISKPAVNGTDYEYSGKFINFSTDEVFGPAPVGHCHKEDEEHRPSNPYSASKSAQEAIGYSFYITYGLPVITTHTMNCFGIMQTPEKLIPKTIRAVVEGKPMPIFADVDEKGELKSVGSRFWIHAKNTASAVLFLLVNGIKGERYNIIGFDELTNLEVAEKVAKIVGKPLIPEFVNFHKSRPGHDMRYALSGEKMKNLGWKPVVGIDEALKETVEWTLKNNKWL